jgi:hypothetical protein
MSRLEVVIGTEIVDDIRLGHTFYEVDVLKEFIAKTDPAYFIEVGTHEGGLSYLLIPEFPELNYFGIELHGGLVRPLVIRCYNSYPFADLHFGDCFDPKLFARIRDMPSKIIYCDGGNKAKELLHFKDACQVGDIIMAHDYYNGTRKVRGVPDENISKEVLPMDIVHLSTEKYKRFTRLPEEQFKETRIIGFRRDK